jgi:hypothetical protein
MIPGIHPEYTGYSMGDNVVGFPTGKKPIGTYSTVRTQIKSFKQFAYIPSALSESVSITRSLSSFLHCFMIGSESE